MFALTAETRCSSCRSRGARVEPGPFETTVGRAETRSGSWRNSRWCQIGPHRRPHLGHARAVAAGCSGRSGQPASMAFCGCGRSRPRSICSARLRRRLTGSSPGSPKSTWSPGRTRSPARWPVDGRGGHDVDTFKIVAAGPNAAFRITSRRRGSNEEMSSSSTSRRPGGYCSDTTRTFVVESDARAGGSARWCSPPSGQPPRPSGPSDPRISTPPPAGSSAKPATGVLHPPNGHGTAPKSTSTVHHRDHLSRWSRAWFSIEPGIYLRAGSVGSRIWW